MSMFELASTKKKSTMYFSPVQSRHNYDKHHHLILFSPCYWRKIANKISVK